MFLRAAAESERELERRAARARDLDAFMIFGEGRLKESLESTST